MSNMRESEEQTDMSNMRESEEQTKKVGTNVPLNTQQVLLVKIYLG
jgi:hypothetical protein